VNNRMLKTVGAIAIALIVALAAGWLWGSSGRRDLEHRVATLELQNHLADARARLLAARVDLYTLNFGSAARNLETAKQPLEAAATAFEQDGDADRAKEARAALAAAEEARRLAAAVNQSAQASAERAVAALGRAIGPAGQ
jgi:hypothetical protein